MKLSLDKKNWIWKRVKSLKNLRRIHRQLSWEKRGLPDFIGIGTQKGGTGALFHYLKQHPDLEASIWKEVHFFDNNYDRGEAWYRSHFPLKSKTANKKTYEISPGYMHKTEVPERVKQYLPHTKIIVLLRNPIHRAFSHYHMSKERKNIDPIPFKDAVEKGVKTQLKNRRGKHYSFLTRGKYHEQIRQWLEYFPMDQFLFIKSEDLLVDPKKELKKVYDFIGVSETYPPKTEPRNIGSYQSTIDPETYQKLEDYYREDNKKLVELLGKNFRWIHS